METIPCSECLGHCQVAIWSAPIPSHSDWLTPICSASFPASWGQEMRANVWESLPPSVLSPGILDPPSQLLLLQALQGVIDAIFLFLFQTK